MKIVYFGTPEFAVKPLEALINDKNIEILAVVTQPDKPQGRKQILTSSSVKKLAQNKNLKVLQPKNKKELASELQKLQQTDFFVVIAFGMILTKDILKMPKFGCINVHASLLPKYRGASPIQEALFHGESETGITIMQMDEELDHGDIFLLRRQNIAQEDNYETLSKKLSELTGDILPNVLLDIKNGHLSKILQENNKATHCHKIEKHNGEINFQKSAKEINNMLRAYTPWPGIFTKIKGKNLKILKMDINPMENLPPGKFKIEDKKLKIGTKKGILLPKILQMEGKNSMDAKSFINGYKSLIEN